MKKAIPSDFVKERLDSAARHISVIASELNAPKQRVAPTLLSFSLAMHALTDAAMAYATRSQQ